MMNVHLNKEVQECETALLGKILVGGGQWMEKVKDSEYGWWIFLYLYENRTLKLVTIIFH
jgi:hypothetical protein